MIIIHVVGGLGNQLYCYAMYQKLRSLGRDVKLDISDYLPGAVHREKRDLELLDLLAEAPDIAKPRECTRMKDDSRSFLARVRRKVFGRNSRIYTEQAPYDTAVFELRDAYLEGYYNTEAYYTDILKTLRKDIVFPVSGQEVDTQNALQNRALRGILQDTDSCALHIRRTDYLDPSTNGRYAGICTDAYYEAAMQYVKKLCPSVRFCVFSDDTAFARDYFDGRKDVEVVDMNTGKDSMNDMYLMAGCRYHICANSTFSMWGARLSERAGKCMIRPLYHDRMDQSTPEEIKKLWPDWILIDETGNIR